LMRDAAARVKAVTLIEQAAMLAPNDMAIRDEKDAVGMWNEAIEEDMRKAEEQNELATQQRGSVWSSLCAAVAELAA
jgi:hypothetical protein